ncbi:hypothetical protein C8F01DRAFT_144125 [Mycena amicta]|nr:hypothetical protein C8F01DRAFT_144125 [Mycena amicta]
MYLERRSFGCPDFDNAGHRLSDTTSVFVNGVRNTGCSYEDEAGTCLYNNNGVFQSGPNQCPFAPQDTSPTAQSTQTITQVQTQTVVNTITQQPLTTSTSSSSTSLTSTSQSSSTTSSILPSSSSSSRSTTSVTASSASTSTSASASPTTLNSTLPSAAVAQRLSPGAQAGLAIGSIIVALLAVLLVSCVVWDRRRRRRRHDKEQSGTGASYRSRVKWPWLRLSRKPPMASVAVVTPFRVTATASSSPWHSQPHTPSQQSVFLPFAANANAINGTPRLAAELRAVRKELESTQGRASMQGAQNDVLRERVRVLERSLVYHHPRHRDRPRKLNLELAVGNSSAQVEPPMYTPVHVPEQISGRRGGPG